MLKLGVPKTQKQVGSLGRLSTLLVREMQRGNSVGIGCALVPGSESMWE